MFSKRVIPILFLFGIIFIGFIPGGSKKDPFKKIAKEAADSIPSLGSFLVFSDGKIVCEKYFNNSDQNTHFNVKSVTKTVVSMLAGAAHDRKLLPGVSTPVLSILP